MHITHSEFITDNIKDMPLWRYMDFWKFLSLLSTSKLFFANVEMLGDQHEGRIPQKIYEMMLKEEQQSGQFFNSANNYKSMIENLRKTTFICSWIASEKESFAMWKMYAKGKLGISVKSNYDRLKRAFAKASEDIFIGEVSYYDIKKPFYRTDNTFYSFLVKHNYYDFESEVRCVTEIQDNPEGVSFKTIDIDLNILIDEIYISPFGLEIGFVEIIEFLKLRHQLDFKIRISGVNDSWI